MVELILTTILLYEQDILGTKYTNMRSNRFSNPRKIGIQFICRIIELPSHYKPWRGICSDCMEYTREGKVEDTAVINKRLTLSVKMERLFHKEVI